MHRRFPFLTIALAATALALWFAPGAAGALEYNRAAIVSGDWWRAITGHFTHWTTDHLAWDLLAFVFLGTLVERRSRAALAATIAASTLGISIAIWLFAPHLESYRGLSGIGSALFIAAVLQLASDRTASHAHPAVALPAVSSIGFVAKSIFELATGAALFVDADTAFVPVPLAHLVGALAGACVVIGQRLYRPSPDTLITAA